MKETTRLVPPVPDTRLRGRHLPDEEATLGKRLKRVRKKVLGLSQAQLAKKVGISQPSLSEYESDRLRPPKTVLRLLAAALNTSLEYLEHGTSPMQLVPPRIGTIFNVDGQQIFLLSAPDLTREQIQAMLEQLLCYRDRIDDLSPSPDG